jgi:hypothetical protein
LLSSNSVEKIGYVQAEVKNAIEVFARFPSSKIFIIPVRLDDCKIDDDKINERHMIDMFPDWNSGINRILRAIQK